MTKTKPASWQEEFKEVLREGMVNIGLEEFADDSLWCACDFAFERLIEQERIKAQIEGLEKLLEPFMQNKCKSTEEVEEKCCKLANRVMAKYYKLKNSQD